MQTEELYNPKKIEGILLCKSGDCIVDNENTGFQEYPKSIELWQKFEDGRLIRIQRWLKKSISHYIINNCFETK